MKGMQAPFALPGSAGVFVLPSGAGIHYNNIQQVLDTSSSTSA
jgi:hypothetical protein